VEDPLELWQLRLPGREARFRETPFDRLDQLVPAAARGLLHILDRPFAFYGHSVGGVIAFELARYLSSRHSLVPRRLFVAACPAPHIPWTHAPLRNLPDDQLLDVVNSRYQAIPEAVLRDAEFRQFAARTLRADFSLIETYAHAPAAPLDCPITAFAGAGDTSVAVESIRAWSRHGSQFQAHTIPGDHFFLQSAPATLVRHLAAALVSEPNRFPA
jgi:medium-chain acyl-[acyl-carrier-protein] hydrolase